MVKIFDILKKEHNDARNIIAKIQKRGDEDGILTSQLIKNLEMHMAGEEKFFYPELEQFNEMEELIFEAYEEHEIAERILRRLRWMAFREKGFMARLKILHEILEVHIKEEENTIFNEAKKLVSSEHFDVMAENYMEYKERKLRW